MTTKEEVNKLAILEQRMQELLEENRSLKYIANTQGNERVTVRHSGYGPSIVVPLDNDKSAVFSSDKGQKFYQIPMETYLELKNSSPFFEMGYLYTDDQEDNPNLILDVEGWFESRTERAMSKDLDAITSPGTLNMLYNFTEGKSGGKILSLRDKVSKRLNDVLDIVMLEDSAE